jgi:hypothetical protein
VSEEDRSDLDAIPGTTNEEIPDPEKPVDIAHTDEWNFEGSHNLR